MQNDATEQPTPRSPEWLTGWDAGRAQVGRLASVVTRQRSEIDTLRATLVEVERAQLERDCAAVCGCCRIGEELRYDDEWHHMFRGHLRNVCSAGPIRDAFAALHPEPEGKEI